jgi:hypothetical protein
VEKPIIPPRIERPESYGGWSDDSEGTGVTETTYGGGGVVWLLFVVSKHSSANRELLTTIAVCLMSAVDEGTTWLS